MDLISYTVSSLNLVVLNEATHWSGDVCGSTFLNRVFARYLNKNFGGQPGWDSNSQILAEAMDHFETKTKARFDGERGDSIPVKELTPQAGIVKNRLQMSSTDLEKVFDSIVSEAIKLIKKQIQGS